MPVHQRLWTGPPGAALRDCLLAELERESGGLWIVPTPLARDQLTRRLALSNPGHGRAPRLHCWNDLWRLVRHQAEDGPCWLSRAAVRTVFEEAIRQVREQGQIAAIHEAVIQRAGYQRHLQERFQAWTIAERPASASAAVQARDTDGNPVEAAEWSVYVQYRGLLGQLSAEDDAGFAVWASRRLARSPRFWAESRAAGPIIFLDLEHLAPAQWRILERSLETQRPIHVTLAHEPDPGLAEVYLATEALRARLLELGLVETRVEAAADRPAGLREAERSLFRGQAHELPAISTPAGLIVRGAPQGDGVARLMARDVRALRDRGVASEEILILFRHWSDEADLAVETLRAWGIPAHAEVPRPLRCEPAVSALRLAITIPLQEWETELIVRLLRHGMVRPAWPRADRLALATAASTIKASLVFRGREQLLRGLDMMLARHAEDDVEYERAGQARAVAERLLEVLMPLDQPRRWADQVDELHRVAGELGMMDPSHSELDPLWDALDDQADMLERLGRGEQSWTWADFAAEIDAIVFEARVPPPVPAPGSILLATVDQAEGARASHLILADLAEGTFPARAAVEPLLALGPGDEPDRLSRLGFAREMLRFLRVLGSADREVILTYPTTDLKGQELLRAGFLDDLLGLLEPRARASCHVAYPRLHAALIDQPDLAGADAEMRIRAVALASEQGEFAALVQLAGDPDHRSVLDGAAAALFAHQRRLRGTAFSEFEGLLQDGAAIVDVGRAFDSNFRFSPSQLETYVTCPFQFFSKYVLGLEPVNERDELDEDPTERGSRIHDILENFETLLQQQAADSDLAQVAAIQVDRVLKEQLAAATDLDLGLWEIERGRLIRTIGLYVLQRLAYQQGGEARFTPHLLEFAFGEAGADHPEFEIGQGGRTLKLRGRIDRIDLADMPEGARFRVIDYKSGSVPSSTEVKQGEMLQLPLYAMAVERLLFANESTGLFDIGYWSLKKDGFKSIAFESWDRDQEALVAHVLALVDQLRRGVFVVQSRKPGCENYCDYRGVCRVRQVRQAEKRLERSLPLLSVQSRRGRGQGSARKAAAGADLTAAERPSSEAEADS
jgi:ATP-dependent helicase/nuclease subunit B